jgi:hypothetical protein
VAAKTWSFGLHYTVLDDRVTVERYVKLPFIYLSWSLVVALKTGRASLLDLGNHRLGASTQPLTNLEQAIVGVFTRG